MALIPLLLFSRVIACFPVVTMGSSLQVIWPWVRGLGIPFSLRLDGLSFVFALFICGIGTIVVLSGQVLLEHQPQVPWFFFRMLVTIGTFLGITLAEHALTLGVFWHLIPLLLLIPLGGSDPVLEGQSSLPHPDENRDDRATRRIVSQSLAVLLVGNAAVLVGLLLLAEATRRSGIPTGQIFSFQAMLAVSGRIKETPLYAPSVILLLIGCGAYAGLFPFSFWLPRLVLRIPILISGLWCVLLPATTGLYLLMRLAPILGGTTLWSVLLVLIGTVTMLISALLALYQHRPSGLLAWGTISSVGMLTIGIGLGGGWGTTSVVAGVFNHVLAIGALFLTLILIGMRGELADLRVPAGGWTIFPLTTTLALLAMGAFAGVPGSMGFIARDALFDAGALAIRSHSPLLPRPMAYLALASVIVSSGLTLGFTWRLFRFCIGRNPTRTPHYPEAPRVMLVGMGVVVGVLGWGGIGGISTIQHALEPMAFAMTAPFPFHLRHWHGVKPSLLLNILVFAVGFIVIFFSPYIIRMRWPIFAHLSIDRLASQLGSLARVLATFASYASQRDKLRTSLTVFMGVWIVLIGTTALLTTLHRLDQVNPEAIWFDLLAHQQAVFPLLLIPIGMAMMFRTQSRLEAVMALGMTGMMLATFFALSGAPEPAMLQLLVQGIVTMVLLRMFPTLPARLRIHSRYHVRLRDALIGMGVGSAMGFVVIATSLFPAAPNVSPPQPALSDAGGDAWLIHARGLDSVGVFVGLLLAMLGITQLLRGQRVRDTQGGDGWAGDDPRS